MASFLIKKSLWEGRESVRTKKTKKQKRKGRRYKTCTVCESIADFAHKMASRILLTLTFAQKLLVNVCEKGCVVGIIPILVKILLN